MGEGSSNSTTGNNEVLRSESLPPNHALTFMHVINDLDSRMNSLS